MAQTQPELVARHCAEAGLVGKSVGYWLDAGRKAVQQSTMAEAIARLHSGLDLVSMLSDGGEREKQELDLLIVMGAAIRATKGYAASELSEIHARARELCEQLQRRSDFLEILGGQWVFHLLRGELDQAEVHAREMRCLAKIGKDDLQRFWAAGRSGEDCFYCGKFAAARSYLEQSISFYDPKMLPTDVGIGTQNSNTAALIHLSRTLLCLGYPDQARLRRDDALGAAAGSSPHDKAFTLSNAWHVDWVIGGIPSAPTRLQQADEILALSCRHGFLLWFLVSNILRGWSLAVLEDASKGIPLIEQSLAKLRATNCILNSPFFLILLAEAHCKAGAEEGLDRLAEALQPIETTQERWAEAEIYRIRGALYLSMQKYKAAEENLEMALVTACHQKAKLWELRATVSLSRLRCDQGRDREASDLQNAHLWLVHRRLRHP